MVRLVLLVRFKTACTRVADPESPFSAVVSCEASGEEMTGTAESFRPETVSKFKIAGAELGTTVAKTAALISRPEGDNVVKALDVLVADLRGLVPTNEAPFEPKY